MDSTVDIDTVADGTNSLKIAYMNIKGQSTLSIPKENQIQDFIKKYNIDILHCQEINIEEESFSQCNFIAANFNIYSNNALNKYGTATLVRNNFIMENMKMDTEGRAVVFDIDGLTFGNIYLHSGTDAISRGNRERYCSEVIPQLLLNRQVFGCIGGDWNSITDKKDCTRNPDSKMSPSLKRMINVFELKDSFRHLHPNSEEYSRYYSNDRHGEGASRIDRSYHWGHIQVLDTEYVGIAFSDHLAHVVTIALPKNMEKSISPKTRPFFKTSPEVVHDKVFQDRLKVAMEHWKEILNRGLDILSWWEVVAKPGIKNLAITRSKELNKQKRGRLNALLLLQSFYTKELQNGDTSYIADLRKVQAKIEEWYENESQRIIVQSKMKFSNPRR